MDNIEYDAIVKCLNCGNQWNERIPHGTLVAEHIKQQEVKCLNCKCEYALIAGGVTA